MNGNPRPNQLDFSGPGGSKRLLWVMTLFVLAPMLVLGGVLFVVFVVIYPSPGTPIASVDVRPDVPFSLEFTSDGEKKRAFLTVDCTGCGGDIAHGTFGVWSGDSQVASHSIDDMDNGYTYTSHEWPNRDRLIGHLLFDIPPQPAGAKVRITGTLTFPPPTLIGISPPSAPHDGPPPKVTECRIWVAK